MKKIRKIMPLIVFMMVLVSFCLNTQEVYAKNKTYSAKEIKSLYTKTERARAKEIVKQTVRPGMDPATKCWVLYKWFGENVYYPATGTQKMINHQARGPLTKGRGVCQGQAMAYNLMCYYAGVDCYYVESFEANHAYTIVRIQGKWYIVDTVCATMGSKAFLNRTTDGELDRYWKMTGFLVPHTSEKGTLHIYSKDRWVHHIGNGFWGKRVPKCKKEYDKKADVVYANVKEYSTMEAAIAMLESLSLPRDREEYYMFKVPKSIDDEPIDESARKYFDKDYALIAAMNSKSYAIWFYGTNMLYYRVRREDSSDGRYVYFLICSMDNRRAEAGVGN